MKLLILISTLTICFAPNFIFAQFNKEKISRDAKIYEPFKFLNESSGAKLLNNNKSLVADHLAIFVHSPDRFDAFIQAHKLPTIIYLNDEWAELNPGWIAKFTNDALFELRYAKFIDSSNSLLKNPKMFAFIC